MEVAQREHDAQVGDAPPLAFQRSSREDLRQGCLIVRIPDRLGAVLAQLLPGQRAGLIPGGVESRDVDGQVEPGELPGHLEAAGLLADVRIGPLRSGALNRQAAADRDGARRSRREDVHAQQALVAGGEPQVELRRPGRPAPNDLNASGQAPTAEQGTQRALAHFDGLDVDRAHELEGRRAGIRIVQAHAVDYQGRRAGRRCEAAHVDRELPSVACLVHGGEAGQPRQVLGQRASP